MPGESGYRVYGHSTLAYAINVHRPWEIYQDPFQFLVTCKTG